MIESLCGICQQLQQHCKEGRELTPAFFMLLRASLYECGPLRPLNCPGAILGRSLSASGHFQAYDIKPGIISAINKTDGGRQ